MKFHVQQIYWIYPKESGNTSNFKWLVAIQIGYRIKILGSWLESGILDQQFPRSTR